MHVPGSVALAGRTYPAMSVATVLLNLIAVAMLSLTLLTWRPDNNPRSVLVALLLTSAAALVWTLVRGVLLEQRDVAVMVALAFGALAALTWGTDRELAAFANGSSAPMLSVFAVWFLAIGLARVIAYAGTAVWGLAIASHSDETLLVPAVTVAVQVVVATEVLGRLRARLDLLARTDELTGALNRRGAHALVTQHLARRARLGTPLTVLALDVDDLRAINNRDGHPAGDAMLRAIVDHLRSGLRPGDEVGRLGGDEFLVVLPGADHGVGDVVARRLAEGAPASWSVGVAEARADDDPAALLARADARMYERKQARRGLDQA
ncbi:hypothetical protein ASF05_00915 [Aeromicrobium sp. Leaf245]|nr:hypothetical protein ASF05_00915 [Aeromicrobium sp. Leaf245]